MIARAQAPRELRKAAIETSQLDLAVGSSESDVAQLRDYVRKGARNHPGIYIMRGVHGEVLYVGKSTQIRTRLLSYFRLPWPEHRHARMLRETARIEWEETPSEFAALLREVRLIRAHLPKYNVRAARPLDRWWVITIGEGPAPRLRIQRASTVARNRSRGAIVGPFVNRRPLVDALRVLNDALGLRNCPERVPMILRNAGDLFGDTLHPALMRTPGCHRYETRRCLGPCVGGCSEFEYRTQLTRGRAVLEGRDNSPQQQIAKDMASASASLSYERAGWLRDRLTALQQLEDQLARVRESLSRPSFVYAVPGVDGQDRLYLVRNGRVADDAPSADDVAMRIMNTRASAPIAITFATEADQLDELLMIDQWFRTRPAELGRTAATVTLALATLRQEYPTE